MNWFKRSIPNILSCLRIVLIIPFIFSVRNNDHFLAILIAVTIVLTDFLDGKLARAWQITSRTGKILDPLADKICTALAAVSLVYLRGFPLWLLIIIVGRDIVILVAGVALLRYKQIVAVSDKIGRITIVVIAACLMIYLFSIESLKLPIDAITVLVILASVVSYGFHLLKDLRQRNE